MSSVQDAPRLTAEQRAHARRADPWAFWVATWFGCGLSPIAPGTLGAFGAIPIYLLVRPHGTIAVGIAAAIITLIGIAASRRVARASGQKDPQIVVIDETAGVLVTWIAAPDTWVGLVAGMLLFRVLDVLKPYPCRWCERRIDAGVGIMLDDVCAGLWGAAMLVVLRMAGWL